MKRLVLLVAIGSLAIGAAACEDTQKTQSRSSVCADPEPVSAGAGAIQFVPVGDANNVDDVLPSLGSIAGADPSPPAQQICVEIGRVAYDYEISKYETTNAQYVEFLNSQASECQDVEVCNFVDGMEVCTTEQQSDVYVLYPGDLFPAIVRTGEECSYVYTPEPGKENWPVQGINFFMATRFANWYENGNPAFTPSVPNDEVSICTQALQKVFFEAQLTGCKGRVVTVDGKLFNLPYEDSPTTTSGAGVGLTLDTYFQGGGPNYNAGNRMFKIRVNNPGSGYQIGDTVTAERGSIKRGFAGCNNAATITLNASHFRTTADLSTEAGSALVCPNLEYVIRRVENLEVLIETKVYQTDIEKRSAGAEFFVPSGDEWHKAAYYNPATTSYSDFPTDTKPTCACPGTAGDAANCASVLGSLSDVGAYPDAESWYGTFDQAGNVTEWSDYQSVNCDSGTPSSSRLYRGAAYLTDNRPNLNYAQSISAYDDCLINSYATSGFRIAKCTGGPGSCQPDDPTGPIPCP